VITRLYAYSHSKCECVLASSIALVFFPVFNGNNQQQGFREVTEGITAPPVHSPTDTSLLRRIPSPHKKRTLFFIKNRRYFPGGGNRQRGRKKDSEPPRHLSAVPFLQPVAPPFRFVSFAFLSCHGPVGANAISLAFLRGEAMGAAAAWPWLCFPRQGEKQSTA